MTFFCISFWLFARRCSLAVARRLVFRFDSDCLIFLVLYVIDRWLVKSTKGAPHILFHFHCSSSSSTFFSAFSFLSWSWSLSPHFKIGRVAHTNSDFWTLPSMLWLHWISFLTLLCFPRSSVVKEELKHIEYPCWPSDQTYTDPKSCIGSSKYFMNLQTKKKCNVNRW